MVEISPKLSKSKKEFKYSNVSMSSNEFRNGPQYFTKIKGENGWDDIKYFVDK